MSATSYLTSLALLAVLLAAVAVTAIRVGRALFPGTDRVIEALVAFTLAVATLVWLGQILGTVGALARAPLVVSAIVTAGVAHLASRRRAPAQPTASTWTPSTWIRSTWTWSTTALAVGVLLVAVRWVARIAEVLPRGIEHADVLHYHGPMAADWARSGDTWAVSFWSVGDASAYHPGNAELLHALGMVLFGNDLVSFLVNLPFVPVAIAAGWSIGSRRGNGPAGALVVCAVFVLRFMTAEAGQVLNDSMPIAFVLVAAALLDEAHARRGGARWAAVAGIAAGLAVGAKLTVVVPVVALALVAALADPDHRVRGAVTYAGWALLGGGYWYLRNLTHTGSPIPAFQRGPFPGPSFPDLTAVEHSVAEYLTDTTIWRDYFLPGLRSSLGPAWPVLLLPLVAAPVILVSRTTWRRDAVAWLLALVAALTFVSYVLNPASAAGRDGDPWVFRANVRYFFPALLLAGLAALGHPLARRLPRATVAVAAVLVVAASLYETAPRRLVGGLVVVAVVVVVAGQLVLRPRLRPVLVTLVVSAAIAGGYVAQRTYFDERWTDDGPARWEAYEVGDRLSGERIAVSGQPQSFPFYGQELDNDVLVVGIEDDGVYGPAADCEQWWRVVQGHDSRYVAVLSHPKLLEADLGRQVVTEPLRWLERAGAPLVVADAQAALFDVRSTEPSC